ncbi:MAG TPA: ATP-binding protein [Actinomycetes bacterium]|jgi:anti-anti-sigma regulatory factor/anti-sigma regulatory factor (Ser/Thr protein kinase)|nr:ATP-binding protein [Actinomycetes bacterium]
MRIEQSDRNGHVVLTLVGRLELTAAARILGALIKHLDQQPPAIICDLAGVEAIDPVCGGVFTSLRHPALGWPGTVLAVCGARPAVAAVLTQHWTREPVSLYPTLDDAIAQARVQPPRLRKKLTLRPGAAASAAGAFVRDLFAHWELDTMAEPVALLANELVSNAVAHARTRVELRVELCGPRLQVAVHDPDPQLVEMLTAKDAGECGLGLSMVSRVAKAWGVRQDPAGGRIVWCTLDRPVAGLTHSAEMARRTRVSRHART